MMNLDEERLAFQEHIRQGNPLMGFLWYEPVVFFTIEGVRQKFELTNQWEAWKAAKLHKSKMIVDVDALAQFIRTVDGNNQHGACTLAELIVEWLNK